MAKQKAQAREAGPIPTGKILPPSIDSHIHCGIQLGNSGRMSWEKIQILLDDAQHVGAVVFAPVNEVYERSNRKFYDSEEYQQYRRVANEYLMLLGEKYPDKVFPFYFVWNDFNIENLHRYKGVKWHRHKVEPNYDYKKPECETFLQKCYELQLPIVFEEELHITVEFIDRVAGRTPIIIPHLGMMNGGYHALKEAGVWGRLNVYSDSALGDMNSAIDYVSTYGVDKLLLGSDYPFGDITGEKVDILEACKSECYDEEVIHNILYNNIARLLKLK